MPIRGYRVPQKRKIKISYYDGSTLLGRRSYSKGKDILHPSITMPTKADETFVGWAKTSASVNIETALVAEENITLYAIYLPNTYTALTGSYSNLYYSISFIDSNYCGGRFIANAQRAAYIAGTGYQEDNSTFSVMLNRYGKATIGYVSFVYGQGETSGETCRIDGTDVTDSSGSKNVTSSGSHSLHAHGNANASSSYLNTGIFIGSIVLSEPLAWT